MEVYQLSPEQIASLKTLHRTLRDRKKADRVKAVALLGTGYPVPDQNSPEGPKKRCKIVELYCNNPQPILTLKLRHETSGDIFECRSTPGHRFYVRNQGFVHAEEIAIDSELLNGNNERIVLLKTSLDPNPVPVYNFQVEGAHTYFIGENNELCVLSHNQDCGGWGNGDWTDWVNPAAWGGWAGDSLVTGLYNMARESEYTAYQRQFREKMAAWVGMGGNPQKLLDSYRAQDSTVAAITNYANAGSSSK